MQETLRRCPWGCDADDTVKHYLQCPWLWSWTNAAAGMPSRDGLWARLALDPEQSKSDLQQALLHLAVVQHTYVSTKLTPGLWALARRAGLSGAWDEIREVGKRLTTEGFHKYAKVKLRAAAAPPAPGPAAAPARAAEPVHVAIASPQASEPPSDATQIDVSDT